jgi:hypothetical protein
MRGLAKFFRYHHDSERTLSSGGPPTLSSLAIDCRAPPSPTSFVGSRLVERSPFGRHVAILKAVCLAFPSKKLSAQVICFRGRHVWSHVIRHIRRPGEIHQSHSPRHKQPHPICPSALLLLFSRLLPSKLCESGCPPLEPPERCESCSRRPSPRTRTEYRAHPRTSDNRHLPLIVRGAGRKTERVPCRAVAALLPQKPIAATLLTGQARPARPGRLAGRLASRCPLQNLGLRSISHPPSHTTATGH